MTRSVAWCRHCISSICIVALFLILTGCGGLPMPAASPEAAAIPLVAPKRQVALPLPAELGRSVAAAQIITLRRDGPVFAFEARLSTTPERLLLVGGDSLGRRAMPLQSSNQGVYLAVAPTGP